MSTGPYEGVVRGDTIVLLEDDLKLADGTKVLVTPIAADVGSAAAALEAILSEPHVTAADVEHLQAVIDASSRPMAPLDPFSTDTEATNQSNG